MGLRRAAALGAAIGWSAAAVEAQEVSEGRVREAVEDAARGLGQAVAGGSPMTGPAGTTGGLGHLLASLGVGVTRVEFEDPQRDSGSADFFLPTASARLAVGITDGIASTGAVPGFGAVDVLGRVGLLTARDEIEDAATTYGLGLRVGILGETALTPAISVALFHTWTEEIAYGEPDEVSFEGDLAVTSLRADLSKGFVFLSPYIGVGIDRTGIDASYAIPAEHSTSGDDIEGSMDPSSTHQVFYAGVDLSLLVLTASIEGGIYDEGAFAALAVRAGL